MAGECIDRRDLFAEAIGVFGAETISAKSSNVVEVSY